MTESTYSGLWLRCLNKRQVLPFMFIVINQRSQHWPAARRIVLDRRDRNQVMYFVESCVPGGRVVIRRAERLFTPRSVVDQERAIERHRADSIQSTIFSKVKSGAYLEPSFSSAYKSWRKDNSWTFPTAKTPGFISGFEC